MLKLLHGPYRLTAGQQVQDEPTGAMFRVKKVEPSHVVDQDDVKWPIARTTYINHKQRECSLWRDDVRVTPAELVAGDEVDLAAEVTYGAPDVPERLRQQHVKYTEFMSNVPLERLNSHNAIKFVPATDKKQADEIAELRAEKARLLAENERLAAEVNAKASDAAKLQQENADRREAAKNQPQQQGKR